VDSKDPGSEKMSALAGFKKNKQTTYVVSYRTLRCLVQTEKSKLQKGWVCALGSYTEDASTCLKIDAV